MKKIYVIGYPRSGNVWLSRSLGDMFGCAINKTFGGKSLARRDGNVDEFEIIQGHFSFRGDYPHPEDFLGEVKYMNPARKSDNDYLIFLYRNPFDVVTSVYKYWKRESIKETLDVFRNGGVTPQYNRWMTRWLESTKHLDYIISYEQLHYYYNDILKKIANDNNYEPKQSIEAIRIYNQLKPTKRRIKESPKDFEYNEGIQLTHLRKGVIGDWINHFKLSDIDYAFEFIGEIICMLGYYPKGCKNLRDVYNIYTNNPESTFAKEIYENWKI